MVLIFAVDVSSDWRKKSVRGVVVSRAYLMGFFLSQPSECSLLFESGFSIGETCFMPRPMPCQ